MSSSSVTSKVLTIDAHTQLCAVIGNPVEHSLSPHMHNAAYQSEGLNYVYLAFRVENIKGCLEGMRALPTFRGMSVTIPHKIAVMEFLDEIEPMAERVGSVNTITNENGKLIGSTTDGPGTLRAFDEAGVSVSGKRVVFLGTGGAVRAVAFAVAENINAAGLTILGRTDERVGALVEDIGAKTTAEVKGGNIDRDLAETLASHDIIIHGTPVGMHPKGDESLVPPKLLRPDHVVFDMVYRPEKTRLAQDAEENGCQVISGLDMLVFQAVLQFERWTGAECPVRAMRYAARQALAES